MKKRSFVIGISAIVCLVIIIVLIAFVIPRISNFTSQEESIAWEIKGQATTDKITSDSPEMSVSSKNKIAETELQTESQTIYETIPEIKAPVTLINLLMKNSNTIDELSSLGCSQLITVSSNGSNAQIDFYKFENYEWTIDENMSCLGFVGVNGITEDMHEGSNAAPKGLYPIGDAFYIYNAPSTGLTTFEVTNDTYWVDDPNSVYYNMRVEGTENKDWNSAEHMIGYSTAYEYGFVIDYNTDAVYNAGSAIFFHISYTPTAGCIGTDRDSVIKYLSKLQSSSNPYILIV